jgi:dTDP-4-dehydrorhamnose reductase
MKILLLGKDGQLGWELQRSLACIGDVLAFGSPRSASAPLDLADTARLASLVREHRPAAIVNAAAYTAVDRAETEPELARMINAEAPGTLAREAAAIGATLVHFSTDYVFDGSGTTPRSEEAATAPLNVYGRSKLAGENLIRASGCMHLILRTSWVYGLRGNNFAKTMLRLARERDTLPVVADQIGAPTGADLIADVTAHALRAITSDEALAGTYHVCASGATSWHGYARHVIACARSSGLPVKVSDDAVMPITSADFPTTTRRPLNSRLATNKLQERLGLHLPDWASGVRRLVEQLATETS